MNNNYYEWCRRRLSAFGVFRPVAVAAFLVGSVMCAGVTGSALAVSSETVHVQNSVGVAAELPTVALAANDQKVDQSQALSATGNDARNPGEEGSVGGQLLSAGSDGSPLPYALILALLALVSIVPVSRR